MSGFFRGVALLVAITCAVWVAVLWRWQATSRDMTAGDIVVYLGLLPLVVFATALLLRWAWRGAEARHAAALAAAATAAAEPAGAAPNADDALRHASFQLLDAQVLSAAGTTPAELESAAKEGQPRPGLDPELRDDDGLPVFAARIADLDVASIAPLLEPHLAALRARQPEWAGLEPPEHVLRALAALRLPLLNAAAALAPWAARFEPAPGRSDDSAERRVRVLLGWPATWTPFEQELARSFAAGLLREVSATPIAPRHYAVSAHAGSGEELLLHADRLLQTLAREQRDEPVLVAACHSEVGPEAVAALEAAAQLFSPQRRPKGRMPGEAAAALLLANAQWPVAPEADPPPHLHRPAVQRRDKSVDAPGRVTSEVLREAMTQALAAGVLGADAVGALVSDADQHTARGAELYGGALVLLPQLDGTEDMRLLASVTGSVGPVGALLVVACAAEWARSADRPCLAVTVGDAQARLALVLRPAAPPAAGSAA